LIVPSPIQQITNVAIKHIKHKFIEYVLVKDISCNYVYSGTGESTLRGVGDD